MNIGTKTTSLVYALLLAVWGVVVGWQTVEHQRVKEGARRDLLNRPLATAKTLVKVIQSLGLDVRSGRLVEQDRLERVLKGLVTDHEVSSVALLNAAFEPVLAAGEPIDFETLRKMQTGQYWDAKSVTLVRRVDLDATEPPEGETNRPSILVPPMGPPRREAPGQPRDRIRPNDVGALNPSSTGAMNAAGVNLIDKPGGASSHAPVRDHATSLASDSSATNRGEPGSVQTPGDNRPRGRRPFWFLLSEEERKTMAEKRSLHGLVIAMSTASFRQASIRDLWMRLIIGAFAGVSAGGIGFAWRNFTKSSELQMRLVRASELNSHLREMNVAAAGLAHETRNPLNIIRGLAQLISKDPDASPEVRKKTSEITDEVDRVTAQLNEFINYSRPREVRRAPVFLNAVVADVVRALQSDVEDKAIRMELVEENLTVEADEQFLRQVLFNLLLNAIQAVDTQGEIQILTKSRDFTEASLEVRDNGPGVPFEQRKEIFKPYFTTHQKGTGLGLAVVQQIVLAHGWEIECLSNDSQGVVFRISRMRLTSKA